MKRFLAVGVFALAAGAASTALAAPCAGFTDVDDTVVGTLACQNVEWIKNRAITLGCTSATLYCPNNNVNRLQMAAFMNRLGTALTPTFLRKRDPSLGGQNFSAVKTLCATDPVPPSLTGYLVTGYPRTAIVTALLNAYTTVDGPGMDLKATIVYSINGGGWIAPATNDGTAYGTLFSGLPHIPNLVPPDDISLRAHNFIDLNVGSTYQFAVQGIRTAGTAAVANAYCELHVQIVSRDGTSSPFDPAPDPGPHGRGP